MHLKNASCLWPQLLAGPAMFDIIYRKSQLKLNTE